MLQAPPRCLRPADATPEQARFTLALRDPLDYQGRDGYQSNFVGGVDVPIPMPRAGTDDLAPVDCPDRPGQQVFDLRYRHFSCVVSKSRRMPVVSCVNLDGTREKVVKRKDTAWRRDPRIETRYQLVSEGIYGRENEGLFSRGHMTRREDPNWGSTSEAEQADADTFHAPNACPQVQGFNAPIWLALEDYIKANAWHDDMRVSVMTGPVFAEDDPIYRPLYEGQRLELRVPTDFWKVVVFQHDDSGEVVATAYMASQAAQLPRRNRARPQFVFGAFDEYQLRIADLQEITQLDFGPLIERDVLADLSEGVTLSHAGVGDVILGR